MAREKNFFKRHGYALLFSLVLTALTGYVLLDTFVLPHAVTVVSAASTANETVSVQTVVDAAVDSVAAQSAGTQTSAVSEADDTAAATAADGAKEPDEPSVTASSYTGNGIRVAISTERVSETTVYVADVQISSAGELKTALAENTYGSNITQTTSEMAEANNAILAVNGDYYGANKRGYVIKNGVLYRDTVRQGEETQDLAISADGSFSIIDETEVTAQDLIDSGVVQLLAFGPVLVEGGEVQVSSSDEVSRAKTNNPRTAIGIIDNLHYLIVVADGRTSASEGLSLIELAELMESYGCVTAYNLDGGGSSTMVFNGTVINEPTTNGNSITERSVSDIVYISA